MGDDGEIMVRSLKTLGEPFAAQLGCVIMTLMPILPGGSRSPRQHYLRVARPAAAFQAGLEPVGIAYLNEQRPVAMSERDRSVRLT